MDGAMPKNGQNNWCLGEQANYNSNPFRLSTTLRHVHFFVPNLNFICFFPFLLLLYINSSPIVNKYNPIRLQTQTMAMGPITHNVPFLFFFSLQNHQASCVERSGRRGKISRVALVKLQCAGDSQEDLTFSNDGILGSNLYQKVTYEWDFFIKWKEWVESEV